MICQTLAENVQHMKPAQALCKIWMGFVQVQNTCTGFIVCIFHGVVSP